MTLTGDEAMAELPASDRLADLYDRHHERLFRFALRLSRDDDEAKDLLQEAFIRAASARVPSDTAAAGAWLVRVVLNLARDRWRRRRIREVLHLPLRESHDPRPALEAAATVRSAMASLPPRQRAVIALHYLEGEPVASIAATLRITQVTVRWHLAAARKRLQEILR